MDITAILENIKSQNIPLFTLLIAIAIALAIVIFLSFLTLHLAKKVRDLSKQRFGFAGKPLFSVFVILGIALAIPLTLYASSTSINMIKTARAERRVVIEIYPTKKEAGLYSVSFMAIPFLDEEAWGDQTYTITWHVTGEVPFEKIEKERGKKNPSYFIEELGSGNYEVKVLVESKNFSVVQKEKLVLE